MSAKVKTEASSPKQTDEKTELAERLELDFVEESAGDEWDGIADAGRDPASVGADEVDTEEEGILKPSPDSPRSLSAPRSPEDDVETLDEDAVAVETDEAVVLHTGEEDEAVEGDDATREAPTQRPKGGGGPKTPPECELGAATEQKGASSNDVSQESSMREPPAKRRRRRHRSSSCSSSSSSAHSRREMDDKNGLNLREIYEGNEEEEDRRSAVSRGRDKSLTGSSPRHRRRRHRHRSKSPPKSYKMSDRRDRSPRERRNTDWAVKREHSSDEHEEDDDNEEREVVEEDEMDYEDDEERIRRNKRARLVRLREARSRQIGHDYIPPLISRKTSAIGGRFPPQPYFKNPSYYPRDKEQLSSSAARSVAVPVPLARVEPMPGGRLPLVQRRSSPPPSVTQRRRGLSPQAPPPQPLLTKKRRYIVEEISHVPRRSRTPPPPLLSSYRSSNGTNSSRQSRLRSLADLGPQTLYPSRRDPYPAPRSYESSRHASSSSYSTRHYESSRVERDPYIFTGNRLIPKPFVPPPPPGKKWNCPRREEPYAPSDRRSKWRCPKREPATPPPRR